MAFPSSLVRSVVWTLHDLRLEVSSLTVSQYSASTLEDVYRRIDDVERIVRQLENELGR